MKGREQLKGMLNIAIYHQAHERFHSENSLRMACELFREAKGLKALAGRWSADLPAVPAERMADPRFRVMGCEDLNQLEAIPFIGALFMEGEGEPRELVELKHRLQGMAEGLKGAGQWLAAAIENAWERQKSLICPEFIGSLRDRYETIATDWLSAKEMWLAGEHILLALECIQKVDFSPAALRKSPEVRKQGGSFLLQAAWLLDAAGRLLAGAGARVTGNDPHWQNYIDMTKESIAAA